MVVDPTGVVTTWVGRDALMWAFKTRAQLLRAQLKEWDDLDQVVTMVTDLERRSGVEVPAAKTNLRDEAARKLAHRLVFNDWIAGRHASWRWVEGILLAVGGLSFVVGVFLLLSSHPVGGFLALVGALLVGGLVGMHWLVGKTPKLKDKENKLYKALTGRDLAKRASTEEMPAAPHCAGGDLHEHPGAGVEVGPLGGAISPTTPDLRLKGASPTLPKKG